MGGRGGGVGAGGGWGRASMEMGLGCPPSTILANRPVTPTPPPRRHDLGGLGFLFLGLIVAMSSRRALDPINPFRRPNRDHIYIYI